MSGMDADPHALHSRLQAGEAQALLEFIDLHHERLLRLIRLRLNPALGRTLTPEDVLQDVFAIASTKLGSFPRARAASSFLWLRVHVLQAITAVHRQYLGAGLMDNGKEIAPPASPGALGTLFARTAASATGVVEELAAAGIISAALLQLAAGDREMIALRHGEALDHDELGELLSILPRAAGIRYQRAAMRLRELLAAKRLRLPDLPER
jgi:RNA polymerase sigma-70 factor (ECF subfamily)